jgi:hypothetical protein
MLSWKESESKEQSEGMFRDELGYVPLSLRSPVGVAVEVPTIVTVTVAFSVGQNEHLLLAVTRKNLGTVLGA